MPAEAAALVRTGGILHHLAVVAVVDLLFVVVDADGVVAMRSARRVPAEFAGQVRALVLSWARRLVTGHALHKQALVQRLEVQAGG